MHVGVALAFAELGCRSTESLEGSIAEVDRTFRRFINIQTRLLTGTLYSQVGFNILWLVSAQWRIS